MHNHSYENEFNLHVNEISFSYERMSTMTRFEKEAKRNGLFTCFSDSLLLDSSISQSHSKLWFKSTNHIESCSLNQLISISERHETVIASFVSILMQISPSFITCYFSFLENCNFYDELVIGLRVVQFGL